SWWVGSSTGCRGRSFTDRPPLGASRDRPAALHHRHLRSASIGRRAALGFLLAEVPLAGGGSVPPRRTTSVRATSSRSGRALPSSPPASIGTTKGAGARNRTARACSPG